ncbi:P-loop containing nucleoside triphosphate hydrolase protein [Blyttiomyces helicus]|uniref:P-loop containing nucleoside triphosphate hydrolase protein n=1 Tax=Blyttiomyces helicus TaxID=388810 RepID=A0A4P9WBB7_9FUNG|nr:P-loop containing nucleoside triphosphate hydrolase protein [Blyttiomyces helicus]|eukprot:RKO89909.1 P-loop containing nucleoside triphosphate hydrolase protein [Blyttiomyces helicus]
MNFLRHPPPPPPPPRKTNAALETCKAAIARATDAIRACERSVFASFCKRIGVDTIEDYERTQLKASQEDADRRVEITTHIATLDSQHDFETQKHAQTTARLETLKAAIASDADTLEGLADSLAVLEADAEARQKEIEEMGAKLDAVRDEGKERAAAVSNALKEVARVGKEWDAVAKAVAAKESEIDKHCAEKFSILRRCKLEEIELPLLSGASLDNLVLDEMERSEATDPDAMDFDSAEPTSTQSQTRARLQRIAVDFSSLDDNLREDRSDRIELELTDAITALSAEIDRMAPNMRAVDRLDEVENKLRATAEEFDAARREARTAKDKFNAVKQQRYDLFYRAYQHISDKIDEIYKELTRSRTFPIGGTAYLSLNSPDEPYLDDISYSAIPPTKTYRSMDTLSGGEKTIAALALLFAIHSFKPAPFFVLDEVDAALDAVNVAKLAAYVRGHAADGTQFIVISLKAAFYEKAHGLVGVYRDLEEGSSRCLTLDVEGRFEE